MSKDAPRARTYYNQKRRVFALLRVQRRPSFGAVVVFVESYESTCIITLSA
jgi:hypothetical protein